MPLRIIAYTIFFLLYCKLCTYAQLPVNPPNIDFEMGTTAMWQYSIGSCCPIYTPSVTPAIAGRHQLAHGTVTDPYGGFPVVPAGSGLYTLKLGNKYNGAEAEQARYYIHVPATISDYSLIYRYAVVFEDPGHTPADQPRFEVTAYDSITGTLISCAHHLYIASSSLPGFHVSPIAGGVYYKDWSTGILNLSGQQGKTIAVDFATGDCGLGAHFGYGYIDMSCGLFAISVADCDNDTVTLAAPEGFAAYTWYDTSTLMLLDSNRVSKKASPAIATTYAVILTPYPGYGCTDTLYTTVYPSHLSITPINDTTVCPGTSFDIAAHVSSTDTAISYTWKSGTNILCTGCDILTAQTRKTATYMLTATDSRGCVAADTFDVDVSMLVRDLWDTVLCNNEPFTVMGGATGAHPPFLYSWTSPVTLSCTTCAVTTIPAGASGALMLTVTASDGCSLSDTFEVSRDLLSMNALRDTFFCTGDAVTLSAITSGTSSATSYNWEPATGLSCNTCRQTVATPAATTSLCLTVTGHGGCVLRDTVQLFADEFDLALEDSINACGGVATPISPVTNAIAPEYKWAPSTGLNCNNCTPAISTTTLGMIYTVSVTDSVGCVKAATTYVTRRNLLLHPMEDTTICYDRDIRLADGLFSKSDITCSWSPDASLSCGNCLNPIAHVKEKTTFALVATDAGGCTVNDTINVDVERCDIWFPSAFTPNRDGLNDIARVVGYPENCSKFLLAIYNRYGQEVFKTTNIKQGWDGIFNNIPQDLGVYFYKILYTVSDGEHMLSGDLTLIR